ncbi:LUD domain-containing protein [Marinobacteraceae bacterium S3BR75-40.1]
MSRDSRERILARLRQAPNIPAGESRHERTATPTADSDQFLTALRAAHAEVIPTRRQRWPEDLARLAEERGWRRWAVGGDSAGRLWSERAPTECQVASFARPFDSALQAQLFTRIDASVTGCVAAAAETGTLLLASSPSLPRSLSLIPPVHVALVNKGQIEPDVASCLTRVQHDFTPLPTNLLWISGPSKTADIQQTLAYGAHGPRELIVLYCEDA